MTNNPRRISGDRTAEDVVREYYARISESHDDTDHTPGSPPGTQPAAVVNLQNGFYQIDKQRILAATTPDYRQFLREAGYGDLDSCSGIGFAKGILKYDQAVRDTAARAGLSLTGNDGEYVININHPDARKLVEALEYKLSTTRLMYNLFIPYIKELSNQGNPEAQATLENFD